LFRQIIRHQLTLTCFGDGHLTMFGDMSFPIIAYTENNQANLRTSNIDDMFGPFWLTAKPNNPDSASTQNIMNKPPLISWKIAAGLICAGLIISAGSVSAALNITTANQLGIANTWPFTPTFIVDTN